MCSPGTVWRRPSELALVGSTGAPKHTDMPLQPEIRMQDKNKGAECTKADLHGRARDLRGIVEPKGAFRGSRVDRRHKGESVQLHCCTASLR